MQTGDYTCNKEGDCPVPHGHVRHHVCRDVQGHHCHNHKEGGWRAFIFYYYLVDALRGGSNASCLPPRSLFTQESVLNHQFYSQKRFLTLWRRFPTKEVRNSFQRWKKFNCLVICSTIRVAVERLKLPNFTKVYQLVHFCQSVPIGTLF